MDIMKTLLDEDLVERFNNISIIDLAVQLDLTRSAIVIQDGKIKEVVSNG